MRKQVIPILLLCTLLSLQSTAQWSLSGNSISSGNFLGTTNTQSLVFKSNNQQVGNLSYSSIGSVSLGVSAGNSGSALCCNVAIGQFALSVNTSGNNTAVGHNALTANTSGDQNTAIGSYNSYKITTGDWNTSVGSYANQNLTTGYDNCSFGQACLRSVVSAVGNNAFGVGVLNQSTASYNNAFGYYALYANTTGTPNCAFGYQALYGNTIGTNNVAMGYTALTQNTTGSQNTAIGDYAGPGSGSNNLSNTATLGYGATVTVSNRIMLGNTSISDIGGFAAWTNFSDGRYKKNLTENVPGLAFIKLLRPVTYTLDATGIEATNRPADRPITDAESIALKEKEQIQYTGFIAQEVVASANQLGYEFSGVRTPKHEKDFYGIRYAEFVVPLTKAVQELSITNDSLKTVINTLATELANIQQQLKKINNSLITGDVPLLKQNAPNPFDDRSIIAYNLPSNTRRAVLTITDVQGRVLKSVALGSSKGPGQAVVNAGALAAGVYYYSLVVNGKLVDTKEMVLTK